MQPDDQILCQLLEQSKLQSVLLLRRSARPLANALVAATSATITAESWHNLALRSSLFRSGSEDTIFPLRNIAQFDLVYLMDLPVNTHSTNLCPQLVQCLAQIQGHCRGELVVEYTQRGGVSTDNQFSALGFTRVLAGGGGEEGVALYRYSLHSYKIAPDWLNSKHWANPERWDLE